MPCPWVLWPGGGAWPGGGGCQAWRVLRGRRPGVEGAGRAVNIFVSAPGH